MADTRYTRVRRHVQAATGQQSLAAFQRLFSLTGATGSTELFDDFLHEAAELYAAAHPNGWDWQHRLLEKTSGVTHSITLDASFDSTYIPQDMGFYNVMARIESTGDWEPVNALHMEEINERGHANRTAVGTNRPYIWTTYRHGGVFTLELYPFTIDADTDDIDLYLPYVCEIPAINGASNPDTSFLWASSKDMIVAHFATAISAARMQMWTVYQAHMELGLLHTRADLRKMGIVDVGLRFLRMVEAIEEMKTP